MIDTESFTASMEIDHGDSVVDESTAICTVSVRVLAKDGPAALAKLIKAAGVVQ